MVYETTIKISKSLRDKLKEKKSEHETYNEYIKKMYKTINGEEL